MARPLQKGLNYFPLDTNFDDTIELLEAKFGLEGFAIFIKLLQKIYSNNYYLDWNEEIKLLFAKKHNLNIDLVNEILNYCLEKNIFNNNLFLKFSILTSSGIQSRYFKAIERRKDIEIINEYILIDLKKINANMDLINVNINSQNVDINSQSKVKYSIVNKNKENNIINNNDFLNSENKTNNQIQSKFVKMIDEWNELADKYKFLNKYISMNPIKEIQKLSELIKVWNKELFDNALSKASDWLIDSGTNIYWYVNNFSDTVNGKYNKKNNFKNFNKNNDLNNPLNPSNYNIKYPDTHTKYLSTKLAELTTDKEGKEVAILFHKINGENIIRKVLQFDADTKSKYQNVVRNILKAEHNIDGKAGYMYV